jgi:hypothetical protein
MSRAYYDLQAQIRPGWLLANPRSYRLRKNVIDGHVTNEVPNPARWKEPPHVAFANISIDAKAVRMFNSTYGPLFADVDEIPNEGDDEFQVNLTLLGYMQDRIREVWRDKLKLSQLWIAQGRELFDRYILLLCRIGRPSDASWRGKDLSGLSGELLVADCWTYLRMLLARDLESGRARICKNPECVTPYFVAGRTDQDYCCHKCSSGVSVKRFRKRERSKKKKTVKRRKR